jgi:hypothetical protein
MTSLLPPPDCGLHFEFATMVDRRGISAEDAQNGGQPCPQPGPCPLCKGNHWRSKCPCLQMEGKMPLLRIDGSWPPVPTPLLGIDVEEPHGGHYGRKTTDHFPARQWSSFLCLAFLPWTLVQWQGYRSGQIWPASRALIYLASGLLLGRPPLLSLFPHSF